MTLPSNFKKFLTILVLGFYSGLPLGMTGSTLTAWYTVEGLSLTTIGLLAMTGQPYVYKFLWAAMTDKPLNQQLGRRRSWLMPLQIGLALISFLMASLSPLNAPFLLAALAFCFATFSATQDIVIDAYRTEIVTADERGLAAAWGVSGYRMAMLVSGGLTLIVADKIGFSATYFGLGLLISLSLLVTWWMPEPSQSKAAETESGQRWSLKLFAEPIQAFLTRPMAYSLLGLVLLYKLGDAYADSLATPFLLRGVGFTLVQIGLIKKTVGLVASLLGVFLGGLCLKRQTLIKTLLLGIALQYGTHLFYIWLYYIGPEEWALAIAVALESIGGGFGTAAFIALLMSLCDPKYTAAHYALLSALSAVGRVYIGPIAGWVIEQIGWVNFYWSSFLFILPTLWLIYQLQAPIRTAAQPAPA